MTGRGQEIEISYRALKMDDISSHMGITIVPLG